MKSIAAMILCAGFALSASSQPLVNKLITETEEQYSRSQTLRAEAIAAFRDGNLPAALAGMKRALEDRPANVALLGNALFLAAETGSAQDLLRFAEQYAALGVAPGEALQAKMREKLPANQWAPLERRFAESIRAKGRTSLVATIPTRHRLVEGVTAGPDGVLYFSTVVSGTIAQISPTGEVSVLLNGMEHGAGSFFGIAYSEQEQALYATYGRVDQTPGPPQDNAATGVLRIDTATGMISGNWPLPDDLDGQQIADLAVGPDGTVYVTEAQQGALYKIDDQNLTMLETGVRFRSPQGLAFLPGGILMMADYGRGLWRINADTAEAMLLAVPTTLSLIGIDGLIAHKGRLIAIQNGVSPHRIVEIILDDRRQTVTGLRVLAQNLPEFDEPTLGTSTDNGLVFVASSQWPKYGPGGSVKEGQTINPTKILRLLN